MFGPAAREIKWDSQRHKRHQRWHLPDTLKGANSFLTDRIDGLITDATSSPFTKNILPYMYKENPDGKIKWNVYSFDEGLATRVPYESAARVLPQSKRTFAGYAVPQGIAIAMEHNFMMSPEGMQNFRRPGRLDPAHKRPRRAHGAAACSLAPETHGREVLGQHQDSVTAVPYVR